MSDKPISKGDLVMVVRPLGCCGSLRGMGKVFEVPRVVYDVSRCTSCGQFFQQSAVVTFADCSGFQIAQLKRLDPGNLSEDVPTKEELTA